MPSEKPAKVTIIGAGPAGYAAAIYAARAGLQPLLLAGPQPGGQLTITTDVENYPGFTNVLGPDLMASMKDQAVSVGTTIIEDTVTHAALTTHPFALTTDLGRVIITETLIIATGAQAKWLNIPGEDTLKGYGVSACATCDGFFFKNKTVAVIGGGNTAAEEAIYLTNHASHVYLVHRRQRLRAENILQDRVLANPKITPIWNTVATAIEGRSKPFPAVTGLLLETEGKAHTMPIDGVFVAIGHSPATSLFTDQLAADQHGYLTTQPGSTHTSIPGVFAAGDVADAIYRQAVTAAGTGCMAALDAERFLAH